MADGTFFRLLVDIWHGVGGFAARAGLLEIHAFLCRAPDTPFGSLRSGDECFQRNAYFVRRFLSLPERDHFRSEDRPYYDRRNRRSVFLVVRTALDGQGRGGCADERQVGRRRRPAVLGRGDHGRPADILCVRERYSWNTGTPPSSSWSLPSCPACSVFRSSVSTTSTKSWTRTLLRAVLCGSRSDRGKWPCSIGWCIPRMWNGSMNRGAGRSHSRSTPSERRRSSVSRSSSACVCSGCSGRFRIPR